MMRGTPDSDPQGQKLVFDFWPEGVSRMSVPMLLVLSPEQKLLGRLRSHASGEETLAFLKEILNDNPHLAPQQDPTATMVLDDADPAQRDLARLESRWSDGERVTLIEPLGLWLTEHGESWDHGAATVKTLLGAAQFHAGDRSTAMRHWHEVVARYPDHPIKFRAFHNIASSGGFPWLLTPELQDATAPHAAHSPIIIPNGERRRRNLEMVSAGAGIHRFRTTRSGLPLVRVEPGTFKMGGQPAYFAREAPVRQVTLTQPFLMAAWPVTYGMWRRFRPEGNPAPADARGDDLPWTRASIPDALEFCRYLSEVDGIEYRLPTEAQWEYAARGGLEGASHPWGSEPPSPERCSYDNPYPVPVACYEPNAFGLFDMVGNWMEWTADPFAEDAYALTPYAVVDPVATGNPEMPYHALRGGGTGLDFFKHTCRNGFRVGAPDSYQHFAFRVIATAD